MSGAHVIAVEHRKRRRRRPPRPDEGLPVLMLVFCAVFFLFNVVAIVFAPETVIYAVGMAIQGAGIVYWWPRGWPPLKRWIIGEGAER